MKNSAQVISSSQHGMMMDFHFWKKGTAIQHLFSLKRTGFFFSELLISPAFCWLESPDNRLKSSRTEAAEVGAEEREQVALFSTSGADGAETREQLSRESSAVRGSEMGRTQPKNGTWLSDQPRVYNPASSPKHFMLRHINHPLSDMCAAKEDGRNGFKISHLLLTLPQNHWRDQTKTKGPEAWGRTCLETWVPRSASLKRHQKIRESQGKHSDTLLLQLYETKRIVKKETYQVHLKFQEYQKDQARLTRSFQNWYQE